MGEEEEYHVEFGACELYLAALQIADFFVPVYPQFAECDIGLVNALRHVVRYLLGRFGPAKHRTYAGKDLADYKRFGHIVIGSDVQTHHLVVFAGECRAENHRSVFGFLIIAYPFGKVESAELIHHYVDHEQRVARKVHFKCLFGTIGAVYFIAFFFKVELENFAQSFFVVDY